MEVPTRKLKRSTTLPARLREKKVKKRYNYLGISFTDVSSAEALPTEKRMFGKIIDVSSSSNKRKMSDPYVVRKQMGTSVTINTKFVTLIDLGKEGCDERTNDHIAITTNPVYVNAINVAYEPKHLKNKNKDTARNSFAQVIETIAQLDEGSMAEQFTQASELPQNQDDFRSEFSSEPQVAKMKLSCMKKSASEKMFKDLSHAFVKNEFVNKIQRASLARNTSAGLLIADRPIISDSRQLTEDRSAPRNIHFDEHFDERSNKDQGDSKLIGYSSSRRKSWFQRLTPARKHSTSSYASSEYDQELLSQLENSDLREIFLNNPQSELYERSCYLYDERVKSAANNEPWRKLSDGSHSSGQKRHVSFSSDLKEEHIIQQPLDKSSSSIPMTVEDLIARLSNKSMTDSDKECVWRHFYSTQLTSEQIEDQKMLKKWQHSRQAKDRNMSIFTLDMGRTASLRNKDVRRSRSRRVCRVLILLLLVSAFVLAILLGSWLASGGKKYFGSI